MVIFILLFLGVFSLLDPFFAALFAASGAVTSFCVLLIFAFVALALTAHNQNRWWGLMFLAVIAMVAIDILAPFEGMLVILGSAFIAFIGTVTIKTHINRFLRADAHRPITAGGPVVPQWLRGILMVI